MTSHLISLFSTILALSVGNFSSQPRKQQPLDLGPRRLLEPQTPSERLISPSSEPSEAAEYLWKERRVESFILTLDVGMMTMTTEGISLGCIHRFFLYPNIAQCISTRFPSIMN